ncbi:MAG: HD domain-containing protein [Candidatus Riflebacteria bacterium]|nr:HD domain-containing protein [Candidatus Riflebacteria bacterium]
MASSEATNYSLSQWERYFKQFLLEALSGSEDPAHDISHTFRVVENARKLCLSENGCMEIVIPAAWLHDCVVIPKDSDLRKKASYLASEKACEILVQVDYPIQFLPEIQAAIISHSFSANIHPETLEGKIIQDSDRLDAIGAIGIARCFATGGLMKKSLLNTEDPFSEHRVTDDKKFILDHFFVKLLKLQDSMNTKSAKIEAGRRIEFLKIFLEQLKSEIFGNND